MPKVGEYIRFWTMEECVEYYKNTYQPTEYTARWGQIAIVVEIEKGAYTIRFRDGETKIVGSDTIKEDDEYRLACALLGEDYFA